MNDPTAPPLPSVARRNDAGSKPSFLRALRGVWLFTWKSQLTWRRFPVRAISLLVLPILVYLTLSTPQAWTRRHPLLGNPARLANEFSRRLQRARLPLQPEQRASLQRMFREEFTRTESELARTAEEPDDADRRSQLIATCYERLGERAKTVLNERQAAQFQRFANREVRSRQSRAREPRWNWSTPFYYWLINFYFFIILPLGCVRASGALIRDELEADTLRFLITRPVGRARLLAAKYISQTAWLQILFLLESLLLFAAGVFRHIPALGALLPLFLATQLLAVLAWSALGTLLGMASKRYLALALLYGFIVELGIGRIPTNIHSLSLMRHLKTLLAHDPALQALYQWSGTHVAFSAGALVLATGIFLGCAMLLFVFIEYHHAAELQK